MFEETMQERIVFPCYMFISRSEIFRVILTSYPLFFNMTLYVYGNRLLDVLMIITYIITTDNFRTASVFVVVSFCTVLRSSFMRRFPQAIQLLFESKVSCGRIQVNSVVCESRELKVSRNILMHNLIQILIHDYMPI